MTSRERPPTLLLSYQNRLHRIPLPPLAEALHLDETTLVGLLLRAAQGGGQAVDNQREETTRFNTTFHETKKKYSETFHGGGVEGGIPDEKLVRTLATELGDEANVGWLRRLVARYPQQLLVESLRRTMAVPAEEIRKSRGAYFTGVVRILAKQSGQRAHGRT